MLSEVTREKRAAQRAFLDAFKRALGCRDCGTTEGRLDLDHRDKREKKMKVSLMVGYGWRALLAEVEKCDVRCASCHARRHHIEEPGARAGRGIPKPKRRAVALQGQS